MRKNSLIMLVLIVASYISLGTIIYSHNNEALEEGYYKIPVNLWHYKEDKESMGSMALTNQAEIHKKDQQTYLYINSKKMEFANILSTLINIYYLDEDSKVYKKSKAYDYVVSIPDTNEKFPSMFELPIKENQEYIDVMVDPKVEVMGDQPIKARIKLDYTKLEKIDEDKSDVISRLNSPNTKEKSPTDYTKTSRKVKIRADKDSFEEDFDFYANKVVGNEEQKLQDSFKQEIIVSYRLDAFAKIDEIPLENAVKINESRKKLTPKNQIQIDLPQSENMKDFDIYMVEDGKNTKIEYEILDGNIIFLTDRLGVFSFVKKGEKESPPPQIKKTDESVKKEQSLTKDDPIINNSKDDSKNTMLNSTSSGNFLQSVQSFGAQNFPIPSLDDEIKDIAPLQEDIGSLEEDQVQSQPSQDIVNVKVYKNDEGKTQEYTKENYGVIFLCVSFIIAFIVASIILIRVYYLKIVEEMEIYTEINKRKSER